MDSFNLLHTMGGIQRVTSEVLLRGFCSEDSSLLCSWGGECCTGNDDLDGGKVLF